MVYKRSEKEKIVFWSCSGFQRDVDLGPSNIKAKELGSVCVLEQNCNNNNLSVSILRLKSLSPCVLVHSL